MTFRKSKNKHLGKSENSKKVPLKKHAFNLSDPYIRQEVVYETLKAEPFRQYSEIEEELGLPQGTVKKDLQRMQKEGLIQPRFLQQLQLRRVLRTSRGDPNIVAEKLKIPVKKAIEYMKELNEIIFFTQRNYDAIVSFAEREDKVIINSFKQALGWTFANYSELKEQGTFDSRPTTKQAKKKPQKT